MNKTFIIVSNGFANASRAVDLEISEEDFLALPSKEQYALALDATAELMDIGVNETKNTIEVTVSIGLVGLVGCVQKTELDYTPSQWNKIYPEEQEQAIIDAAWECVDYSIVHTLNYNKLRETYTGIR